MAFDDVGLIGDAGPAPFALLPEADLARIEGQADRILAEIGIRFDDAGTAARLFRPAGAVPRGDTLLFDGPSLRALIRGSAPAGFVQHARNPARSVRFGGGAMIMAPAFAMPFVTAEGGRRHARAADLAAALRRVQSARGLAHGGGMPCEPTDLPPEGRHLRALALQLALTDKPVMGPARDPRDIGDALDIMALVFGDRDRCVLLNLFNTRCPLQFGARTVEGITATARAGQAALVTSYAVLGLTAPITLAGALAVMLAELMVGAALTQLVRPGAPVMVGMHTVPFSISAMTPQFWGPETALGMFAAAQLMRRLGLPFRIDLGPTSSKTTDAQAASDTATALAVARAARPDFSLHAAGWLDGAKTFDAAKFDLDAAILGRAGEPSSADDPLPLDAGVAEAIAAHIDRAVASAGAAA